MSHFEVAEGFPKLHTIQTRTLIGVQHYECHRSKLLCDVCLLHTSTFIKALGMPVHSTQVILKIYHALAQFFEPNPLFASPDKKDWAL